LVGVEIIRLQKILKLVSFRLETQADMTLLIRVSCNHGERNCIECRNSENRTGKHRVSVAKYTVLPYFVFISQFLRDLKILIHTFLLVNHPVYALYTFLFTESIRLKLRVGYLIASIWLKRAFLRSCCSPV
jgi:hypothetical protein